MIQIIFFLFNNVFTTWEVFIEALEHVLINDLLLTKFFLFLFLFFVSNSEEDLICFFRLTLITNLSSFWKLLKVVLAFVLIFILEVIDLIQEFILLFVLFNFFLFL